MGKITAIEEAITESAKRVIDAKGRVLLPGLSKVISI